MEFTTFEPHRTNPTKGKKKLNGFWRKNSQEQFLNVKKKQEKEPFSGRYKIIKYKKKKERVAFLTGRCLVFC